MLRTNMKVKRNQFQSAVFQVIRFMELEFKFPQWASKNPYCFAPAMEISMHHHNLEVWCFHRCFSALVTQTVQAILWLTEQALPFWVLNTIISRRLISSHHFWGAYSVKCVIYLLEYTFLNLVQVGGSRKRHWPWFFSFYFFHLRSQDSSTHIFKTEKYVRRAALVAQQFSPAFSPGCDPGDPGSSLTSGSLHGACFSLCLCLCLLRCVSLMNK